MYMFVPAVFRILCGMPHSLRHSAFSAAVISAYSVVTVAVDPIACSSSASRSCRTLSAMQANDEFSALAGKCQCRGCTWCEHSKYTRNGASWWMKTNGRCGTDMPQDWIGLSNLCRRCFDIHRAYHPAAAPTPPAATPPYTAAPFPAATAPHIAAVAAATPPVTAAAPLLVFDPAAAAAVPVAPPHAPTH